MSVIALPSGRCVYCDVRSGLATLGEFCPTSDPNDPDLHYFTPSGSRDDDTGFPSSPVPVSSSGQPGVHGTATAGAADKPPTPLGASGLTHLRNKGEPA